MSRVRDITKFLEETRKTNTNLKALRPSTTSTIDSAAVLVMKNASGMSVFSTLDSLPVTSLTSGQQAYVTETSRIYVSNGNGWYNVAVVNATPSLTLSSSGTIALTAGSATTITMTATDSDNDDANLVLSLESGGDLFKFATISQDSSVVTITPRTQDSATALGSDGSATLTFKASDGINQATVQNTFTLSFGPDWSGSVTEKKLTGSGLAAYDGFGTSVALSGDGLYALVGSPFDDDTYSGSGSAFVFTNNGNNVWSQQVKLAGTSYATTNPPTSGYLYFGSCARLNSDGSRAAVSAYRANHSSTSGQDFGQIYVLTRSGTSWSKEATLDAPEAASYMTRFDANQDMTYIVSGSGSKDKVSVYTRSGTSWSHQQTFTGGVSSSGVSQFGRNVGISEDTNYIIVGGSNDDYNSVANAGAAYIWKRSGSTWSQEAALYGSDRASNDQMGYGVALNSDATIAVAGARYSGSSGDGAAYVFTRSGSTWTQVQKLTGEHGPTWSGGGAGYVLSFGYRVHIPKGNDDLLLISAPKSHQASPFVAGKGEVYVFEKTGTGASTYSYRTSLVSTIDLGSGSNETGEDLQSSNDGTFVIAGAHNLDFTADNAGGSYVWTV